MKVILVVFLVGALAVNPTHSCKPSDTVSFFKELNENYQLVERAKAAAGKQSSSVPCFNKYQSLDTALFSADVFTDVANGITLYYGPDPNTTVNETEGGINDGRITKPHPVWGLMTVAISFNPMMVVAPILAIRFTAIADKGSCTKLGAVLLAIPLSLVFTALATPAYVLFVIGLGIFRAIAPKKVTKIFKMGHGLLKTLEISLESAIQTCLGKVQSLLIYNPFSSQGSI